MTNPKDNNAPDELDKRLIPDTRNLEIQEWQARLAQRPKTDLGVEAAVLLQEERTRRDREIGLPRS